MTSVAIAVDESRCVGCFACEIACNQFNQLEPGVRWISVSERGPELVDGRLSFGWQVGVLPGCNVCAGRRARGEQPACVQHCIAGCIRVVER